MSTVTRSFYWTLALLSVGLISLAILPDAHTSFFDVPGGQDKTNMVFFFAGLWVAFVTAGLIKQIDWLIIAILFVCGGGVTAIAIISPETFQSNLAGRVAMVILGLFAVVLVNSSVWEERADMFDLRSRSVAAYSLFRINPKATNFLCGICVIGSLIVLFAFFWRLSGTAGMDSDVQVMSIGFFFGWPAFLHLIVGRLSR